MKVHLVRWHKEWSGMGLVIIDINDGVKDSLADLKASVEKSKVPFPVLWDKDTKVRAAYGVTAEPSAFLLGVDGKVLWEGVPNSKVEDIEKRIKAELDKVKK